MPLSRRDLLAASTLLLAGPGVALRAAAAGADASSPARPIVLCWNENPYGPSPAARLAVSHAIASGCRYPPDEETDALTATLAQLDGVSPDHIVTGNGCGRSDSCTATTEARSSPPRPPTWSCPTMRRCAARG